MKYGVLKTRYVGGYITAAVLLAGVYGYGDRMTERQATRQENAQTQKAQKEEEAQNTEATIKSDETSNSRIPASDSGLSEDTMEYLRQAGARVERILDPGRRK
ncbi:MAG: hypothetical protein AABZ06_05110 [Bdellovibrionota bacterium]